MITLPTRVIFLDYDGCTLTLRTMLASGKPGFSSAPFDPITCRVLERVCRTGISIVVSSTWREGPRWRDKLEEAGLMEFIHPTCPITPSLNCDRSIEINDWLSTHPEVTDYRIIDDDHFNWTPEQIPKWIQCEPHDGLGGREMAALMEWAGLNGSNKASWPAITARPHLATPPDSEL